MRRRFGGVSIQARAAMAVAIVLALGAVAYVLIEKNIFPVIITMAEARAQTYAVRAMNDAVRSTMKDPEIYSNLVRIVSAEDGTVAMVQANTALINDLATQISQEAQNNLMSIGEQGIKIPVGSITGSQLLSGRGPKITIKIIPVGTVQTQFRTEFENAGINQTRHKVIMDATASVSIILPGEKSRTVHVTAEIPISESIIIGKVPDSYVSVDEKGNLLYSEALGE